MPRKGKRPRVQDVKRTELERQEIEQLEERIPSEVPESGSLLPSGDKTPKLFADIPISKATRDGLLRGGFRKMTLIQQFAILHGLVGRDILGAAKTGSGKTLAFLIPVVEKLFRLRWSIEDGLGAVIISPTRELAMQIFEVLQVVNHHHSMTLGIIMGGKSYRDEARRIQNANILVCTPGRLLQHFEQTPGFDASNVQALVLDEADRILDMGFQEQLNNILTYLPPGRGAGGTRQTMLFSATQTKSVKELAKLSLYNPEYVSVASKSSTPTPSQLAQSFVVCDLGEKLNVLYSFIRSHLKSKVIVFFSSCKQVRYVDAAFRKLRPGVPLMSLHGKIKQKRRMFIYYDFVNKPAAVMFATDIAARGLDFPAVDWVVQMDCPESVDSYIHRVGRTARYKRNGKAMMCLSERESEGMVPLLKDAKIPIHEIKLNQARQQDITTKLQAELAKDPELKMNAQKAFKSYVRSVHLQPNKEIFDAKKLPMAQFAGSLGLISTPRVKFAGMGGEESRKELRAVKNKSKGLSKLKDMIKREKEAKRAAKEEEQAKGSDEDEGDTMKILAALHTKNSKENKAKKTKWERLIGRKATDPVSQAQAHSLEQGKNVDDSDDDILEVKRRFEVGEKLPGEADDDSGDDSDTIRNQMYQSERARKRIKISAAGVRKGNKGKKTLFNEDGTVTTPFARFVAESQHLPESAFGEERDAFIKEVSSDLAKQDAIDRENQRAKIKARHREQRLKLRAQRKADQGGGEEEGAVATLGGFSDNEMEYSGNSDHEEYKPVETLEDAEAIAMRMIEGNR